MHSIVTIPAWQRPHWQPSDEEIMLQYYVFGKFSEARPPLEVYGSKGLPQGITITNHGHAELRAWEGYPLRGDMSRLFKDESPEAYRLAVDAPQVMIVRGRIKDSPDTGYLRDVLATLAALLDVGGVAVLDPMIVSLFDADTWRRRYLVRDGAPIRNHLLILREADGDEQGFYRISTRGMRKYGRPDIVIEHVPEAASDRAGVLCERMIELEALGAHFSDGQTLETDGALGKLVAHLGGGLDDPRFNNSYVRFRWPA